MCRPSRGLKLMFVERQVSGVNLPFNSVENTECRGVGNGENRPQQDIQDEQKRPRRAASVESVLKDYAAFFLLAIPISPSKPEPKSQTAGGIGTTAAAEKINSPDPSILVIGSAEKETILPLS